MSFNDQSHQQELRFRGTASGYDQGLCPERGPIRHCEFLHNRVRNILLLAYEISGILCSFSFVG